MYSTLKNTPTLAKTSIAMLFVIAVGATFLLLSVPASDPLLVETVDVDPPSSNSLTVALRLIQRVDDRCRLRVSISKSDDSNIIFTKPTVTLVVTTLDNQGRSLDTLLEDVGLESTFLSGDSRNTESDIGIILKKGAMQVVAQVFSRYRSNVVDLSPER